MRDYCTIFFKVIAGATSIDDKGECRQTRKVIRTENPDDFVRKSVESDIVILILQKDIRLYLCKISTVTLPPSTLGNRKTLGNFVTQGDLTPIFPHFQIQY